MIKLLSHIFSSDELIVPGHDLFNTKYSIYATDQARAHCLLSDALLDVMAKYDDLHLSIAQDKMMIWMQAVDEKDTYAIINIVKLFAV